MGGAPSSLGHVKNAVRRRRSSAAGRKAARAAPPRPPTPDYHKDDAKEAPPIDVVVSPVSPAPSESPRLAHADPGPHPAPIPRKSLPAPAPSLPAAPSLPDVRPAPAPSATDQPASSARNSAPCAQSPAAPRASAAPSGSRHRGRDGTLYAEMRVTRDPDPRAACFPVQTDAPLAPGTIISARPPKDSHFNCYQRHRTMNRRSNRNYPLTCQTCDKADVEDRWVCTFCHLRICDACMRRLNGHQRVLRRLVDELAVSTPLSLSSMSRSGSAHGLHAAKPA